MSNNSRVSNSMGNWVSNNSRVSNSMGNWVSNNSSLDNSWSILRNSLISDILNNSISVVSIVESGLFHQEEQQCSCQRLRIHLWTQSAGRVQTVNYADNGDGIVQDVTY